MGGRGGTSMSGKSSKARGRAAELSLKTIDSRMEKLADTMAKTAAGHTAYLQGAPSGSASDHNRYAAAQREYQRLQGERSRVIDEMAKSKKSKRVHDSAGKTFVNSFGEATTREITSLAYKRAQRRMERDILRHMGY